MKDRTEQPQRVGNEKRYTVGHEGVKSNRNESYSSPKRGKEMNGFDHKKEGGSIQVMACTRWVVFRRQRGRPIAPKRNEKG